MNSPKQDRLENIATSKPSELSKSTGSNGAIAGMCVLLVVAVLLVFGQTLRHEFLNFDDDQYFYSNPQVQAGLTWNGVIWAFRTTDASNWHPLTWLSLMLDVELFGTGPAGPHLTNVLLHAANTVLLFLLLRRTTGAYWRSAFVAVLFGLHPLHVESVAWVAERKDVLSGLFFMLTLLMYARYVQGGAKSQGSGVRWWASRCYWLAVLFFALGLMSKPMLVTLPFVLLLLDYWPLGRVTSLRQASGRLASDQPSPGFGTAGKWRVTRFRIPVPQLSSFNHLLVEKLPFLLLSTASCVVTVLAQQKVVATIEWLPMPLRIGNALVTYITYLGQMFYPTGLAVFYPHPVESLPAWKIELGLVLVFGISVAVLACGRKHPYLLVGWLWYLGTLVPVIGLMQVGEQARADRYTYLPLIGVFVMLAWGAGETFERWRYRRQVLGAGGFIVAAVLMVCASIQTSHWRNSESLWKHTLACTSRNAFGHINLGNLFTDQGRTAEAIEHYQAALEIRPDFAEAHNNLGTALAAQGHAVEAIDQYLRALEIKPDFAMVHYNLGVALANQGRYTEAIQHYQRVLEIKPDFAESHNNLGSILDGQGRSLEAVEHFKRAVEIKPDFAEAHFNLGVVLTTQGQAAEAIEHYRQALKIKPDYAEAHYRLALTLKAQGRFQEAIAHYRKALELKPRPMLAQNALAWLLATCPEATWRNGSQAVELAQQAEQLSRGKHPEILDTLAAAYAEAGRFPEAIETAQRALDLSVVQNNKPLADALQMRLKLYEANSTFHEKP
jgi:tetratricopeptide (TPR) repeat protein